MAEQAVENIKAHLKGLILERSPFTGRDAAVLLRDDSLLALYNKSLEDLTPIVCYRTNHAYLLLWLGYIEVLKAFGQLEDVVYNYKYLKSEKIGMAYKEYYFSWALFELEMGRKPKALSLLESALHANSLAEQDSIAEMSLFLERFKKEEMDSLRGLYTNWIVEFIADQCQLIDKENTETKRPLGFSSRDPVQQNGKQWSVEPKDMDRSKPPPFKRFNLGKCLGKPLRASQLNGEEDLESSTVMQEAKMIEDKPCMASLPLPALAFPRKKVKEKWYFVLHEIGTGATAKVYKVMSAQGEVYALKTILLDKGSTAAKRQRHNESAKNRDELLLNPCQEVEILNRLKGSSHVIQCIAYEILEKEAHIILEFGETDLGKLIKTQGHFNLHFIRYYFQQMVRCIKCLHDHGILHCDIKPSNFILVSGVLKCIDFGISRWLVDKTDMRIIPKEHQVGTVNYMAPEALNSYRISDSMEDLFITMGTPSDIWSLACILHELVYGETPYAQLGLRERVRAIMDMESEVVLPGSNSDETHVPEALRALLQHCLRKNVKERMSMDDLYRATF